MRKLILCLVAVGCIQAAFLFYNSADNEQTSLRIESAATEPQFDAVDEILSTWPRTEVATVKPPVEVASIATKRSKVTAPTSLPAVYRRQSVARVNRSNDILRLSNTAVNNTVFASNLIRYDDSLRLDKPKSKRSLGSKTLSVIKKPYDWLKALGSKLN